MKKTFVLPALLIAATAITATAQEKAKVEKKIEVTEKNGVKEVTVKETRDGKTSVKVMKGHEAEAFLKEEEKEMKHEAREDGKEVKMEKKVIIKDDKKSDKKH